MMILQDSFAQGMGDLAYQSKFRRSQPRGMLMLGIDWCVISKSTGCESITQATNGTSLAN